MKRHDEVPEVIEGAYQAEIDEFGGFCWLGRVVSVSLPGGRGIWALRGDAPVSGTVRIETPQLSFSVAVSRGPAKIVIPVDTESDSVTIRLHFSAELGSEKDIRVLCFKARQWSWKPLPVRTAAPAAKAGRCIPLVEGRGIVKGLMSSIFSHGWLRMNVCRLAKGQLALSGIISPARERIDSVELVVNGQPLADIRYNLFNPDYNYLGRVAFEGWLDLRRFKEARSLRFQARYRGCGRAAVPWYQDWVYPLSANDLPMPDDDHTRRIGSEGTDWFLFSGATFVEKIGDAMKCHGVSTPSQEISVLDWGCGCGRLTRHLLNRGYRDVTGIDIDPINIAWCRENLVGAEFRLVDPEPPTDLDAGRFDLIVAHSVFTHLGELDQFMWLAELNRLLKPGGIALVTVMGGYSTAIEKFRTEEMYDLLEHGFLDTGWQDDGVDVLKPGFYRRVFHSFDYILSQWSNYFKIRSIWDGYSDHQALVTLQREVSA